MVLMEKSELLMDNMLKIIQEVNPSTITFTPVGGIKQFNSSIQVYIINAYI